MEELNLKLKDNVSPDILLKYGFKPKYDENTGNIILYKKSYKLDSQEKHFTFELINNGRRIFYYSAWMSGFDWGHIANANCMKMLFNLIKDDIVELVRCK